jgi:serine protease inhibitor
MGRPKRYVLIVLLALCLALLAFGFPQPGWGSDSANIGDPGSLPSRGSPSGDTPQAKALAQSLSKFGFDLLIRQAGATEGNVAISPVSIGSVLSMIRNGARDETEQELAKALGVESLNATAVNQGWADLITAAQTGKKTSVTVCNSLWLREGIPFEEPFLQTNQEYYAADCLPLNNDDTAAVNEINQWVSDRTSGKIRQVFERLDPGTELVAVNTVNLKVGWELFKESDTKPEPFKTAEGTDVNVDMMHGTIETQEGKPTSVVVRDDFNAVCLKTDSPVDVWVAVPTGERTPEDIARALAEGGVSALYTQAKQYDELEVYLPRFEFSYSPTGGALVGDLSAMGIKRLFTSSAQLQGIAVVPTPLFVTSVAHWVHIKLDEKGVEAQAASGLQMGCGALPPPYVIRADRPFLVVLAESSSQAPLFLAIVRDPR